MPFHVDDYCRKLTQSFEDIDIYELAVWMYSRVLRHKFDSPGFALLIFSNEIDSYRLRQLMVGLKQGLSEIHRTKTDRQLCYCSMGRFNQQTTTKFHLDGAPEQSILMLGYEPTLIDSELSMADYSNAAFDLGMTPADFLEQHNPMFPAEEALLQNYATKLLAFDHRYAQILCINNSREAYSAAEHRQLGVFHQATIPHPQIDKSRVVNSTMIGICTDPSGEAISQDTQQFFLTTSEISGAQYN